MFYPSCILNSFYLLDGALAVGQEIRILFALTASAPSSLLVSRYTRSSALNTAYISASMTSHVAGSLPIPRPVARFLFRILFRREINFRKTPHLLPKRAAARV